MTTQTAKTITLKEVVEILQARLNAKPIKAYWREDGNEFSPVKEIKGVELVFMGLTPKKVKSAMKGIELIESKAFKKRAYRWLLRWEHKSTAIKFRCTLYVYPEGKQHFIFTTVW